MAGQAGVASIGLMARLELLALPTFLSVYLVARWGQYELIKGLAITVAGADLDPVLLPKDVLVVDSTQKIDLLCPSSIFRQQVRWDNWAEVVYRQEIGRAHV